MSNKIKISLKNKEKLEFFLEEDSKKGDYISLKEFNKIDLSFIEKEIKEKEEFLLKEIWETNKHKFISESEEYQLKEKEILKLKEEVILNEKKLSNIKHEIEKESLSKIAKLESEKESIEKSKQIEIEKAKLEAINSKANEINELKEKITLSQQNLINIKHEIEKESLSKIAKLESEKESIEKFKLLEIENTKLELENIKNNEIKVLEEKLNKEIKELNNQLDRKYVGNIKEIGEDLENWIRLEFNNNMQFLKNTSFEKANKLNDHTKPDFIFKVFADDGSILTSVTLEAKSEFLNSKTKKQNKDHWEKLNSDRINNKTEYSLLITELESEDKDLTLRSVGSFEKMFEARPNHFISFLHLIYNLAMHKKEISSLDIDLKNKQEILDEFETLKNEIIIKTIPLINNNIKQIEELTNKIIANANKQKEIFPVLDNRFQTIQNKINDFKVQKIIEKISNKNN